MDSSTLPTTVLQVLSPVKLQLLCNSKVFSLRMPISVATPRFSLPLRVDDSSLSLRAHASRPMTFTSSVRASPPMVAPSQWSLNQRHILMLNVIACAVAISASWLFFSAIPTILAFKKAAESLEKLLDVTREELPDTMAAVRLSGMEISDLTMELSDLGQEITRGVRSSTRAVRVAEDGIRHLTNINATAMVQETMMVRAEGSRPVTSRMARSLREAVSMGRAILQSLGTLSRLSGLAMKYWAAARQKRQ
ncbi:uncharacterized protein LOC18422359 isoform X1 [Amborella trichopoda]|uniref:uncharacterized protein LOC18422359 isoform X1 n=1 Tax=Amborella trichopoda TaxID=13333 RepID=UPI0005D3F87B|nr:uncharacterized protein LOC18422359 isoform X1 [Amborella trichopoda]|eukprot:XP_011621795.1 uncharacterized protein LOC18422359 isoform X1 [Amborella trichopoda]